MDFRINEGFRPQVPPPRGIAIFDGYEYAGDAVSSVYQYGSGQATSGLASTFGFASVFTVVPIPEPSTLVLLIAGLGWLLWRSLRLHQTRKG